MLLYIIQQLFFSIILISAVHYIYLYFQHNLTRPAVKDLVDKPKQQYKEMLDYVKKIEIKKEKKDPMKDELKNYLKDLSEDKPSTTTNNEPTYSNEYGGSLFDSQYQTL